MKLVVLSVVLCALSLRRAADAFSIPTTTVASHHHQHRALDGSSSAAATTTTTTRVSQTFLSLSTQDNNDQAMSTSTTNKKSSSALGRKAAVAGAILAGAATTTLPITPLVSSGVPPPAQAVEISGGAFTIQTSANVGSGIVDTKALVTTLIKNRKPLAASLERILSTFKQEISSPVWKEIQKEVLQIEGDLADIKVSPPSDLTQTLKDLSSGKVNFILNGEIVNIAVDETFSREQDELVIRVQGFKGADLSSTTQGGADFGFGSSIVNVYARRWGERLDAVQGLWDKSLDLKVGEVDITAGPLVVGGLTLTIAAAYGGSYTYHVNQKAEQEAAAEEKRKAMAEKRAKAQAAAAAKKDE